MSVAVATRGRGRGRNSRLVRHVTRAAEIMMADLGVAGTELSVLLCGDREIAPLNARYRAKAGPTDVLAFALREGEFAALAGDALGDVVLSIDTAARQAREHGHAIEDEVLLLLAHGLLHLLGWDHRTAAEDRRMRREVDRLVGCVGMRAAAAAKATGPRRPVQSVPARSSARTPSARGRAGRRPYTRT